MSKSKGNVVGADMLADKFGADTARMFILFAGPAGEGGRLAHGRRGGNLPVPRAACYRFVTRNIGEAPEAPGTADRKGITQAAPDATQDHRRLREPPGTSTPASQA